MALRARKLSGAFEKRAFGPNVKNHSARKTMIQALTNDNIPATDIIQLSGHKNLQCVTNYSVVPEKQQIKMSRTLSELSTGRAHDAEKSNFPQVFECSTTTVRSASLAADYQQGQQAMSIFTGAVIHGGQFNIFIISSLNESPTLATPETEIEYHLNSKMIQKDE